MKREKAQEQRAAAKRPDEGTDIQGSRSLGVRLGAMDRKSHLIFGSVSASVLAVLGAMLLSGAILDSSNVTTTSVPQTSTDGATLLILGTSDVVYPAHPLLGAALCAGALIIALLTVRAARAHRGTKEPPA